MKNTGGLKIGGFLYTFSPATSAASEGVTNAPKSTNSLETVKTVSVPGEVTTGGPMQGEVIKLQNRN